VPSADLRPTDLWTIHTPDNHTVRAMLVPRGSEVALVWFVDGKVEGAEDFEDWDAALRRAGELRVAVEGRRES